MGDESLLKLIAFEYLLSMVPPIIYSLIVLGAGAGYFLGISIFTYLLISASIIFLVNSIEFEYLLSYDPPVLLSRQTFVLFYILCVLSALVLILANSYAILLNAYYPTLLFFSSDAFGFYVLSLFFILPYCFKIVVLRDARSAEAFTLPLVWASAPRCMLVLSFCSSIYYNAFYYFRPGVLLIPESRIIYDDVIVVLFLLILLVPAVYLSLSSRLTGGLLPFPNFTIYELESEHLWWSWIYRKTSSVRLFRRIFILGEKVESVYVSYLFSDKQGKARRKLQKSYIKMIGVGLPGYIAIVYALPLLPPTMFFATPEKLEVFLYQIRPFSIEDHINILVYTGSILLAAGAAIKNIFPQRLNAGHAISFAHLGVLLLTTSLLMQTGFTIMESNIPSTLVNYSFRVGTQAPATHDLLWLTVSYVAPLLIISYTLILVIRSIYSGGYRQGSLAKWL